MHLWFLYQVKYLALTIKDLISILCEAAVKINYQRFVVVKKTFKKFLESIGGSNYDCGCVICRVFIY